ncbi:thiamine pyrophosphokinase 1 [Temnothorax longispinosus]|uniref:thiamine pyrophosphokinase 1 n=1 Tax=Temnothorax longispinosus TaxID=300112 RepID=UPI003A990400
MKTEVSWKRRFLRKRLQYMLVCVFVVAVIFVIHQLFYFKELNQATVGKLIAGSVQDTHRVVVGKRADKWNQPYHSKLIRDKNGRTVSLRGTRDQDIAKYLPNVNGKFVCFASKREIDFVKVNDDYCDCPMDGSDEPGTNACSNGFFNCEKSSRKSAARIPSYKVNDGHCDCCDGSDEWAEAAVLYKLSSKFSLCNLIKKYRMMQQEPAAGHGTTWSPLDAFQDGAHCEYAVIVLNRPIYWRHDVLLQFWRKARVTVTVDGGTQRWLKYLEEQGIDVLNDERYVPNLITGDMDSCPLSLIQKLRSIGSTVIETPDQNHTDYTKALLQVAHYARTRNINLGEIYVLAETSGRFDHIIGNVNTLYKSEKLVGNIRVLQVASNSLTWILKPGLHRIHIPQILVEQKSWCGLLPFGCSVNCISTTGLKWNLNNSTMQFGGLISTSNTYENSEVTVNTDTSVIWTMGIESLKDNANDEAS